MKILRYACRKSGIPLQCPVIIQLDTCLLQLLHQGTERFRSGPDHLQSRNVLKFSPVPNINFSRLSGPTSHGKSGCYLTFFDLCKSNRGDEDVSKTMAFNSVESQSFGSHCSRSLAQLTKSWSNDLLELGRKLLNLLKLNLREL